MFPASRRRRCSSYHPLVLLHGINQHHRSNNKALLLVITLCQPRLLRACYLVLSKFAFPLVKGFSYLYVNERNARIPVEGNTPPRSNGTLTQGTTGQSLALELGSVRLIKGRDSGQTLASSQCPLLAASVPAEALGALRLGEMLLKRFKNVSKNISALLI